MRINCPTCELAFEISDDQVGHKALCPECGTRFLIPADSKRKVEILSVGKDEQDPNSGGESSGKNPVKSSNEENAFEGEGKTSVVIKIGKECDVGEVGNGQLNEISEKGNVKGEDRNDHNLDAHEEGRRESRGGWRYLAVGVAIGLLFGFLIGWLIWRSPDIDAAAPSGSSGGENANPFLLDNTN